MCEEPVKDVAILAGVDVMAEMQAPCSTERLFAEVERLDDYPVWMPLAHRVEAVADDQGRPAWQVELRAKVGPLARSKRLRMVRTVHDPASGRVTFERSEVDGRRHSPWVLDASVSTDGEASRLEMRLHYGGSLWTGGVLERVLADQISAGRDRLVRRVMSPA
jgi:hypothetical protein